MRAGFTLIEMSIVLVIIGLIVGGVLVGQSLVHTAQLRKVITEVTKFKTAVNTFKGKYGNLPGDIPNASTYWPTCVTDPNNSGNNCNGNGDGQVDNGDLCVRPGGSSYEALRFWQHLALAGMIEGSYTGYYVPTAPNPGNDPGVNQPPSSILENAFYREANSSCFSGFDVMLILGSVNGGNADGGVMTGADAYSIDTKMDDWLPGFNETTHALPETGNVIGNSGSLPTGSYNTLCTVPTNTPPTYNLTSTEKNCTLYFNAQ